MPTLEDIAKVVGVSPSTVSRALSGRGPVNADLAARIVAEAEKLEYSLARYQDSNAQLRLIGVILPNVSSPFYARLVEGIEKAAQQHGFNVLLGNSDYSMEQEQAYIQLLVKHNVDGILLSPVETHTSLPLEVRKYKIPVVQVDRQSTLLQCDLVKTDSFQGAYDAVRLLIQQGYRRIAIISGPKSHSTGKERFAGYSAALREAGIRVPQDYVQITEFRKEHGYESALQLLQNQPAPDAIFVGNVDLTIGALRAIHELKVHIPDDIGIIGFDDFEFAPILAPPLTTVEQPIKMLALSAVDLLVRRIVKSAPAEPVTIKLVPRLIVRESTRVQPDAQPTLHLDEPLAGFLADIV